MGESVMRFARASESMARLVRRVPASWVDAWRRNWARLVAVGLVSVAVLMRLNNGVRYPALHGYDGFGHVTYIWYILKNGAVPLPTDGWEHFHPPLYYAICAGIWWLLKAIEPRQVLKIISVFFSLGGLISALVSYVVARRYFPERRLIQFLAPAFILFLPAHIYTAPMLGNESLNTVLCSVALYFLLQTMWTERHMATVGLGVALGLAMLTKFTAAGCVLACGLVLVFWGVHTGKWRAAFVRLCVVGVLILAISGWFYVRNVRVYGNPFQMTRTYFFTTHLEHGLATGQRGIGAYLSFDPHIFSDPTYNAGPALNSVWTGAYATTWFDAHGNWFLPLGPYYPGAMRAGRALLLLGIIPTLLILLGLGVGVWRLFARGWDDTLIAMLVTTAVMTAMFVAYTHDNRIFTAVKASYIMPAVVPFSFWFALGLSVVAALSGRLLALALVELAVLVAVIVPVFTYQLLFEVPLGPHHWNAAAVVDHFAGFRDLARSALEPVATGYNFYLAHENLATIALDKGQVHEALFELRQAMRLLPNQVLGAPEDRAELIRRTRADYYNSLVVIYDRLGWDALAFQAVRHAMTLDAEIPETQYDLAVLMIKQGWPEAAIGALQRAIELDPGFSEAHVLLGVAQQRAGECRQALLTLERAAAVKEWPRRAYPHATGRGDLNDAAIARRRTIRHLPPSVNSDYALAVCRAKEDQTARAAQDLAQTLSSGRLPPGALADDAWRRVAGGRLVPKVLPSVVIVMIDTLRADHLGCYGYPRPTAPHLDELAGKAVRFSNAFSTSSWTKPAVTSLFTGLLPSHHGVVNWQALLDRQQPTLAAELAALGYQTAAFSANFVAVSKQAGLDRGFDEFQALSRETTGGDYDLDFHGHHLRGYDARELTDAVDDWLDRTSRRPIFLYVQYLDPHSGYQPPEVDRALFETSTYTGHQDTTAADITELERSGRHLESRDVQHLVDLYDGEIHFTDTQVARLLDRLGQDGVCENCVIVVVADHGEEFQDHGHFLHGFTLYDEVVRIPMILFAHGTWDFRPRVVPESVQLMDLFPTLIEMAGGAVASEIDGRSLLPVLRGNSDPVHESLVAELHADPVVDQLVHPQRHHLAVRSDTWKVITDGDHPPELYRVDTDPRERHDVAATHSEEVRELLALVDRHAAFEAGQQAPLSEGQREQMRALGYLP